MGLPQLTFELKKAADTVAARTAQGVIGMIVKDTKSVGVHVIYQESDIPTDLGADNIAYIKQALTGYINRPTCIYLSVVSSEDGTVSDGFTALGQYSYDYLVAPPDITTPDTTTLADLVKEQRKGRYIGKAVLPDTAADHEGIINFTATNIKVGATTYETGGKYASRIAGILAGTPADCSATYAPPAGGHRRGCHRRCRRGNQQRKTDPHQRRPTGKTGQSGDFQDHRCRRRNAGSEENQNGGRRGSDPVLCHDHH